MWASKAVNGSSVHDTFPKNAPCQQLMLRTQCHRLATLSLVWESSVDRCIFSWWFDIEAIDGLSQQLKKFVGSAFCALQQAKPRKCFPKIEASPPTFYALPNLNLGQVTNLPNPSKASGNSAFLGSAVSKIRWTLQNLFQVNEMQSSRKCTGQNQAKMLFSTDNRAKMQNESLAKQRPKNMRNALAHSNGKCERKVSPAMLFGWCQSLVKPRRFWSVCIWPSCQPKAKMQTTCFKVLRPSKHSCVKTVCRLDNSAVDTKCSDSLL